MPQFLLPKSLKASVHLTTTKPIAKNEAPQNKNVSEPRPQDNKNSIADPDESKFFPRTNSRYVLDVFWCESVDGIEAENATNIRIANRISEVVAPSKLVNRIRVRKLSAASLSIDNYYLYYGTGASGGMDPEDSAIFNVIRDKVKASGIELKLLPWLGSHDNYLSIFVCFNARKIEGDDPINLNTRSSGSTLGHVWAGE